MADYISREVIIKELEEEIEAGDFALDEDVWINRGLKIALKDVKAVEAADVQPVVYCKDCKYAQNPNDSMVYCTYFECGTMSQSDFCSQGTKK